MKRSQTNEENCGHWEYEVQHPVVQSEDGTVEQSSTPRTFGTITRRVRLLRAADRDFTAGMTLAGTVNVGAAENTSQTARMDEPELVMDEQECRRRISFTGDETNEKPSGSQDENGSVVGVGYGVLDTTEDPMFVLHGDFVPGTEANPQSVVAEFSQAITADSLPGLTSGADIDEPQHSDGEDNGDKENRDPFGHWDVTPHRSPLPEWYPRNPLQDITNILASNLDNEQPQPKKKRSKKLGVTQAPTLLIRRENPAQKPQTITNPKPFNCATAKIANNLRMNFR